MTTRIEFLGMAAHRTTNSEGKVILIDPFLEENPFSPIKVRDLERVDLILVTHLAFDHMSDAEEIAKKLGCPVCCGAEVRYWLAQRGVARCRAPTPNFSHESGSSLYSLGKCEKKAKYVGTGNEQEGG